MKYSHTFTVDATMEAVTAFHQQSASMAAITPPPVVVRINHAPAVLADGDEMGFTMWLGPLPIRWLARIEDVTADGFVDRQLEGPFTTWIHRHTFTATESGVQIDDEIEAKLHSNPFWRLLGLGMWLNMPILFAYRQWKTRRLLARHLAYA